MVDGRTNELSVLIPRGSAGSENEREVIVDDASDCPVCIFKNIEESLWFVSLVEGNQLPMICVSSDDRLDATGNAPCWHCCCD